jgi:hypothetical protein
VSIAALIVAGPLALACVTAGIVRPRSVFAVSSKRLGVNVILP